MERFIRLSRQLFAVDAKRGLQELYLFSLIFALAQGLAVLFEPVFFYKEGFSVSTISLYYVVHYVAYALLLPVGAKFAARYGMERSLAVSTPLFVIYFLVLSAVPTYSWLFWVAPFVSVVHKIFYWPAYYGDFAKTSRKGNEGTQMAMGNLLIRGVGFVGPLTGGFIATWFGFPALFVVAAATALLAGFPLLRTREKYKAMPFPYTWPWEILMRENHRKLLFAGPAWAQHWVMMILWPIWIFIVLDDPSRLGIVAAVSAIAMTMFGFIVGEVSDRRKGRGMLWFAAPFLALAQLFQPLAITPVRVLLTDIFTRMSYIGVEIPWFIRLFNYGRTRGGLSHFVAFEIMLSATKAAFALVAAFVFILFPLSTAFSIIFVVAGFFALFYALL